jgi:hypothetical protein
MRTIIAKAGPNLRVLCPQWTKAHSAPAVIPASTNHAPQLAPVRKSPNTHPLYVSPARSKQINSTNISKKRPP